MLTKRRFCEICRVPTILSPRKPLTDIMFWNIRVIIIINKMLHIYSTVGQ